MVALARAILADPRWPWRAAAELGADIPIVGQYQRSLADHAALGLAVRARSGQRFIESLSGSRALFGRVFFTRTGSHFARKRSAAQ